MVTDLRLGVRVWTRGSFLMHTPWDCDFRIPILSMKEDRVFAFPNNSNISNSGSKHLNYTSQVEYLPYINLSVSLSSSVT